MREYDRFKSMPCNTCAISEGAAYCWGLGDLGFTPDDLGPMTQVAGRRFPPERALGTRLEGSVEEAVKSLVAQLRANELIEAGR